MLMAWEQAFGLMAHHGCSGAGDAVVEGIRSTQPGREHQVDQWIAIGECLNRIVEASRTTH